MTEPHMTKIILSIGIYLCLVMALGYVLALTARREGYEQDLPDNEA